MHLALKSLNCAKSLPPFPFEKLFGHLIAWEKLFEIVFDILPEELSAKIAVTKFRRWITDSIEVQAIGGILGDRFNHQPRKKLMRVRIGRAKRIKVSHALLMQEAIAMHVDGRQFRMGFQDGAKAGVVQRVGCVI